jgi:hypothetical protein
MMREQQSVALIVGAGDYIGATASLRGGEGYAAFACAKFDLRPFGETW